MGTGDSLVSFVFGLEVTWDLLQVQLEREAEGESVVNRTVPRFAPCCLSTVVCYDCDMIRVFWVAWSFAYLLIAFALLLPLL